MLAPPYEALADELKGFIPAARLVSDPLRLLAYGTDASFYRLVPKLVAIVESEAEVVGVLKACGRRSLPLTFRAAGTSLSGQAVTDSVLVLLGDGWGGCTVGLGGASISLQPGVIGADANRRLAPYRRKIGPDPASINAAKIGGIAANNASGMCCGTAQNSYHTLAGMRVVLADGAVLDTRDSASVTAFRGSHRALLERLAGLGQRTRADLALAARIRHKFRLKNTTGYALNALVDFDDPLDILTHLMIGSEGTLGFISEITYRSVPDHPDKATALIAFDNLETACAAVALLKGTPVDAVELMDRPALRSVEHKPVMPEHIRALGGDAAALLVETRAPSAEALRDRIGRIEQALAGVRTAGPVAFSSDPHTCERLWKVRKGMFPSVGAMRQTGTTVIIEDVAFPVPRLAAATLDLQAALQRHGYHEAIIFGHALEGNLHFVFTQDFNHPAEVARYERFMNDMCRMVVEKYDGSLKAEHGTGRNIAPFVELEWGGQAYALMKEIKALFDPRNLLNPGVILNDDPQAHLKNLKPMPEADPLVDKCIECGFCEPKCPSHGLTFSPRQRIVGWREISRLAVTGEGARSEEMRRVYDYFGIDTCAACGLCATACPVEIETGLLIKLLRGRRASPRAHRIGDWAADHFSGVAHGTRAGLWSADLMHGLLGTSAMAGLSAGARRLTGGALPLWNAAMPRGYTFRPMADPASASGTRPKVVYYPSCAARCMGPARGDEVQEALPAVAERLLRKAGFEVVYPGHLDALCCGQPFESKGLAEAADRKAAELEESLREASGGIAPIVFDTSPCAYRMKRFLGTRLPVFDIAEFLHDEVLPRLALERKTGTAAVHPVCSVRKMGLEEKLKAVAQACVESVVVADAVTCCGWAGDKGFTTPELNAHALRTLKGALPEDCAVGYSTSRTCEIGLALHGGITYRSIVYLVDACSRPKPESATVQPHREPAPVEQTPADV